MFRHIHTNCVNQLIWALKPWWQALHEVRWEETMVSGPQAPYVSATRGTQIQPCSTHFSSLAKSSLASPAWAEAEVVRICRCQKLLACLRSSCRYGHQLALCNCRLVFGYFLTIRWANLHDSTTILWSLLWWNSTSPPYLHVDVWYLGISIL